jgi:RNA polymerase sigma-70 factor, ECF subfamily
LKHLSDEQLMAAYREGKQEAFIELMKRYEKELYNFLLRFLGQSSLAEDVFQESFLQVHLSADTFEVQRRFRPWLYTIAANKARDLLRSRARRPAVQITSLGDEDNSSRLWDQLLQQTTTPQDLLDQKEQRQAVRGVVADMPDHLREILILAYFNQMPYKDMAETLGIPLGTVKSRLHAAVAEFARRFAEQEKDTKP